jgi:hypothetical protein
MLCAVGEPDPAEQAIINVARAVQETLTLIEALTLTDPDAAFHLCTRLWMVLRDGVDTNSLARTRAAAAVAGSTTPRLTLVKLAKRLSTPDHPISRARAEQLLKAARGAAGASSGGDRI